jgi:phage replication-related protein YjqB (UPF0714/DUF867 family)
MHRDIRNSSKIGAVLRATVLCVGMVSLVIASGGAAAADALTPSQALAHDIYKELLEIDTTTATGDTKAAADAMAARLKAAGFTDADVQVFQPARRARAIWWRGCTARASASRSFWLRISTWFRPCGRTGRSIPSS